MINSIILNRTEIKYILFQSGSGPFPGKTWKTPLEKQKKEKRNMINLYGMEIRKLEALMLSEGQTKYRATQLYTWI